MLNQGSAMKVEQGAACDGDKAPLSEWFCCWDTLEALARDAGRLHEKCGSNCSVEELSQWRDRVMAQLKTVLDEEQRIFAEISNPGKETDVPTPDAAVGTAA